MNDLDNMASPMTPPIESPTIPPNEPPMMSPGNNPQPTASSPNLPLIVAIILALVVLVESIVLVFFGINFFGSHDDDYVPLEESSDINTEDGSVKYDDADTITALNLKCSGDDGFTITFDDTMNYVTTGSSQLGESGTYSIVNGEAIVLNSNTGQERVVYFDDFSIVDGIKFYSCSGTE